MINILIVLADLFVVPSTILFCEHVINKGFELCTNLLGFAATIHDETFTNGDDFCRHS